MAGELNKILDTIKEIKGLLLKDTEQPRNASEEKSRENVLELALEELRNIYNRLDGSYDLARTKILTFLGAGLALLSYLYGGGDLFIPDERYGKVLYFIGLGLVIASVTLLLHSVRPVQWAVPIETEMRKMLRTKQRIDMLELLVEEYVECMESNIPKYERKMVYLNSAFTQLLCGGIILLVIKSIGG